MSALLRFSWIAFFAACSGKKPPWSFMLEAQTLCFGATSTVVLIPSDANELTVNGKVVVPEIEAAADGEAQQPFGQLGVFSSADPTLPDGAYVARRRRN